MPRTDRETEDGSRHAQKMTRVTRQTEKGQRSADIKDTCTKIRIIVIKTRFTTNDIVAVYCIRASSRVDNHNRIVFSCF